VIVYVEGNKKLSSSFRGESRLGCDGGDITVEPLSGDTGGGEEKELRERGEKEREGKGA